MSWSYPEARKRPAFGLCVATWLCGSVIAFIVTEPPSANAAPLQVGDILVPVSSSNGYTPSVLRIDPITGNRSYFSGGGVGGGVEFGSAAGLSLIGHRELYVADNGLDAVLRVDLATGDRSIVSSADIGNGDPFLAPEALWRESENSLLVMDRNRFEGTVVRVDIATGNRSVVSSATQGIGPGFVNAGQLITLPGGDILVAVAGLPDDGQYGAIYRVDPVTGDRTIFSDATHGAGPDFITVNGITRTDAGEIYVTDNWNARVYRIDPATGDRHLIIDGFLEDPSFLSPYAIAAEPSGDLVFTDVNYGEVFRTNPATGTGTLLSSIANGYGEGPELNYPLGIVVIQVPEPSAMTIGILALGSVPVVVRCHRRSTRRPAHTQVDVA